VLDHRIKAALKYDAYDRLQKIRCPTLVITGKDDALISWKNSQILADRISGAKLVLLESAGHCFWLEQPQEAGEALLRFLHAI
jgi:pimeloyl-ACP methyl ester carboxylesterase